MKIVKTRPDFEDKDYQAGGKTSRVTVFAVLIASVFILSLIIPNIISTREQVIREKIGKSAQLWNLSVLGFISNSHRSIVQEFHSFSDKDSCISLCQRISAYEGGGVLGSSIVFSSDDTYMPFFNALDSTEHNLAVEYQAAADYLSTVKFDFQDSDWGCIYENRDAFVPDQYKGKNICTYSDPIIIDDNGNMAIVNIYYDASSILAFINASYVSKSGKTFFIGLNHSFIFHPDYSMIGQKSDEWLADNFGDAILEPVDSAFSSKYMRLYVFLGDDFPVYTSSNFRYHFFACPVNSLKAVYVYAIERKFLINDLGIHSILILLCCILVLAFVIFMSNQRIYYILKRQNEKKQNYKDDLNSASMIQTSMLSKPIKFEGIDISATLIPAKRVGGDLYYCCSYNNRLYFCLGDVSGKGVPAALFMSRVSTLFQSLLPSHTKANELVAAMNRYLCVGNDTFMFVTLFLGIYDSETGKLEYCNAGHDEPLLCVGNDAESTHFLKHSGLIPLGIDDTFNFTSDFIDFPVGSTLFIYTDGITEAMNSDSEQFGEDRMTQVLKHSCTLSAEEINNEMVSGVRNFTNGAHQSDDITVMTVKRP